MYTELLLNAKLVSDVPTDVLAVFEHLFNGGAQPAALPDHPFFRADRWNLIGRCSSHYFQPHSTSNMRFNDTAQQWFILSRSDLKNYEDEIDLFMQWAMPYLDESEGQFVAYSRYEEDNEPKLYFKPQQAVQ